MELGGKDREGGIENKKIASLHLVLGQESDTITPAESVSRPFFHLHNLHFTKVKQGQSKQLNLPCTDNEIFKRGHTEYKSTKVKLKSLFRAVTAPNVHAASRGIK